MPLIETINRVLIEEASPLAVKYKNKSVAEQNSVDLAWGFLMDPEYDLLRATICCDDEEFARFRSLVVNVSSLKSRGADKILIPTKAD